MDGDKSRGGWGGGVPNQSVFLDQKGGLGSSQKRLSTTNSAVCTIELLFTITPCTRLVFFSPPFVKKGNFGIFTIHMHFVCLAFEGLFCMHVFKED